jgi:phosphinothricin acetyltransferase
MTVRDAVERDMAAIAAIYNDVLANSTAIFNDRPTTAQERLEWWRGRSRQGFPTLVADDGGAVAGYASYGDFRSWPGYRFTVEHSVHVHRDRRGRGTGTELMRALIERARQTQKHAMVGGIDADNAASLRFHERLGFERVAHLREVGFKFGRFLDLIFVERVLGD